MTATEALAASKAAIEKQKQGVDLGFKYLCESLDQEVEKAVSHGFLETSMTFYVPARFVDYAGTKWTEHVTSLGFRVVEWDCKASTSKGVHTCKLTISWDENVGELA
jgi:hypothetical protein